MLSLRLAGAALLLALFNSQLTTCRSPAGGGTEATPSHSEPEDVNLPSVDTSSLTAREKSEWSRYVSELLSPCPDQPVSLLRCVRESRACTACLPAVKYLMKQVQRGRVRSQVENAYRARFGADQVKNIVLDDSPSRGPEGAPVLMVEFADFECPVCGRTRPIVDEMLKRYSGQLRLVFKNFPLSMHQYAEKAARAAVAAQMQGKFWEMYAALFDNQQRLEPSNVEALAKSIGLDMTRFVHDRDSEQVADIVGRDRKQGEALGVNGTPALFINGRPVVLYDDPKQDLEDWIDLELELTGAKGGGQQAASDPPAAPQKAEPGAAPR